MQRRKSGIVECQRLARRLSDEQWRKQATAGLEKLLGLAETRDGEALERLRALAAYLRALLEFLQAAKRYHAAFQTAGFQIQDPIFKSREFEIGDLRSQKGAAPGGEFEIGHSRFQTAGSA
jgi:hypothetical protein